MPPKKSRARRSIKQTQKQKQTENQKQTQQTEKQEQRQNISIRIGELPTKKPRRRRPRKGPTAPGREAPIRQLPPIVYQTLPQLTYYGKPNEMGMLTAEPERATSIVEPKKTRTSILEDIGQVGTEGRVEILDVPTKRETLAELITPVDIPRMKVDPVASGSFDIPRMVIDPVEQGPYDIPLTLLDPVEEPTVTALFREQKPTTILEPPMQQSPITQREGEKPKEPGMKSGVESLTSMITEVIRETAPVKKPRKPKRTKAEMEEARMEKELAKMEKQRAKSVPSITQALPVSTMVEVYGSEKFIAEKPRSQTVKGRKKPEGTIIPTQTDVNTFFTPRMQPFVSEKADFFETLSSTPKQTPVRPTSPKPKPKKLELSELPFGNPINPIIRKPRSKTTEAL